MKRQREGVERVLDSWYYNDRSRELVTVLFPEVKKFFFLFFYNVFIENRILKRDQNFLK